MILLGLLIGVNYANADATGDFRHTLPWSVDIVAPKMFFTGLAPGSPGAWCNLSLMEALSRSLFLDEQSAPSAEPSKEVLATKKAIKKLESLTEFVGDIFATSDGNTSRVPMPFVPIKAPIGSLPEEKMRVLVGSVAIAGYADSAVLDHVVGAYSALKDTEVKREFVKGLMNKAARDEGPLAHVYRGVKEAVSKLVRPLSGSSEGTGSPKAKGLLAHLYDLNDPTEMDGVPETLVGFLSSRAVGEMIASLMSDNWARGTMHDAKASNIGSATCRALEMGMKIDYLPEVTTCALLGLILNQLACSYSGWRIKCDEPVDYYTLPVDKCELFPEELRSAEVKSLNFLPRDVAVDPVEQVLTAEGMAAEGPSLHLLMTATLMNDQRSTQSWCQMSSEEDGFVRELLEGWPIVHEVWMNEENDATSNDSPTKVAPIGSMAKKKRVSAPESSSTEAAEALSDGTCEFLIVTRGTHTAWEWYLNMSLGLGPLPFVNDWHYLGHQQYANVAARLIESHNLKLMDSYFTAEEGSEDYCDPRKTTLWFAGHSLGAGLTNMESFFAAYYWKVQGGFEEMVVNAMATASMRVFNAAAKELYSELVNQRNFVFEYDMVPGAACPNAGIPRCDPRITPAGINGEGVDELEPDLPGMIKLEGLRDFQAESVLQEYYNDQRLVFLSLYGMGLLHINENYINLPISLQTGTAHSCSYRCYASSKFCSKNPEDQLFCVRGFINQDKPDNCVDDMAQRGDLFDQRTSWLGSLSCKYNPDQLNIKTEGTHICPSMIAGIKPSTLISNINSLASLTDEL